MDAVEPVGIDKESIAQTLQEYVDSPDVRVKFAWGRKLANEEFLESMLVEGIGEINIPISKEDVLRLKDASIQGSGLSCYSILNNSVRDGWQVDKNKIKASTPSTFFGTFLPNFIIRSLVYMGLDAEALGLDVHFQNLLIYEHGSPFHRKNELKKEAGTFAKLILHIPVEGTSEGGKLRVNYNGEEKYFYFNADSDKQFYSTIFFTDCQHELEEVSSGTKVLMVFNLAWKTPLSKLPPLNQLPAFLKALSELKQLFSMWECRDLVYFPRLLAIPLVHCYDQPVSFSGLKDKDRWMANLFKCIDFVDVFLVLPSNMTTPRQVPDTLDYEDLPSNNLRYEDPDDEDENFIPLNSSEAESSRWIDTSNRPVCFGEVDIHSTELVGNFQVFLPPVVEDDEESLLTDPMVDQLWDQPVLVIWPKKQSVVIACQKQFDAFLDLVERQVGAVSFDRPTLILTLKHVLDYCLKRPISVWYRQDDDMHRPRTRRLFELCVALGAVEEGLQLMKILGNEFRAEIATENGGVQAVWFYEGIRNEHVALAAAAFIELAGWEKCKPLVHRLIESRVNQIHSFCCLAKHLLGGKGMEAAISVAQETLKLLTPDADLKADWGRVALGSCFDLVFSLDGFPETGETNRISDFFSRVSELDSHLIAYVIVHIGRNHSPNLRSPTTCLQFYLELCRAFLLKKIDTSSVPLSRVISDLTTCFMWLEDDQMIQEFIYKMATPTSISPNLLLQKILMSTEVTNQLMGSESGEKALRFLVDARIDELDRFQKPTFTWCQSNASLPPEYCDVEEFLHSPMHSAIFDNFDDTDQITQMVMNYFTPGVVQRGYSAEATIGNGDTGPYCNISKTTTLYESEIAQYQILRKELQHWKTMRWTKWARNFRDEAVPEPQAEDDFEDRTTTTSRRFEMDVDAHSKRRVRVIRRFQANPSVPSVRSLYRQFV